MKRATITAIAIAFIGLWVVFAAGATAVWLSEEPRVFGLVILPTAIVASLLVLYFDWRARLIGEIRAGRAAGGDTSTDQGREVEMPPEPPIAA